MGKAGVGTGICSDAQDRPSSRAAFARYLIRTGWHGRHHGGNNFHSFTVVHQIFQFLTGLEERDLLCRNFHPFARLRVPAHTRLALAGAEAAKTSYFDLVAHSQRAHDAVKDRVHNHFAVFAGEFRQPGNFFDQVSLRHKPLLPLGPVPLQGSACPRAFPPPPVYNLLKFKGFCASGEAGTCFPASISGTLVPVLTSKDSKSRPAAPTVSPAWANNRKHPQTADRGPTACLSAGRPASVRPKYSLPVPYPSPRLRNPRSDPLVSAKPPARRSRLFRSQWRGYLLLSHASRQPLPG